MNTENDTAETVEDAITVVRTGSCPSLSKASTITYQIGTLGDSNFIRLSGNSAGGLYCKEWVSLAEIKKLLVGAPKLTSKTLQPLYAGKSSNSPGFLLAAIVHEKLAVRDTAPADPLVIPPQKKPAKAKKAEEKS